MIWLLSHPIPPPFSVSKNGDTQEDWEWVTTWRRKRGEWVGGRVAGAKSCNTHLLNIYSDWTFSSSFLGKKRVQAWGIKSLSIVYTFKKLGPRGKIILPHLIGPDDQLMLSSKADLKFIWPCGQLILHLNDYVVSSSCPHLTSREVRISCPIRPSVQLILSTKPCGQLYLSL